MKTFKPKGIPCKICGSHSTHYRNKDSMRVCSKCGATTPAKPAKG